MGVSTFGLIMLQNVSVHYVVENSSKNESETQYDQATCGSLSIAYKVRERFHWMLQELYSNYTLSFRLYVLGSLKSTAVL